MLKRLCTAILVFIFVTAGVAAYASQEPVGIIISMYNGAWVQHVGGAKESLALKSPVYEGDVISTDKTGKAQILFNDDTTLAVAPSSVVTVDEYSFNGKDKPSFSVRLVRGASRVISGKIVEQNPLGFRISAPHGTAGIRGTVVSAKAGVDEDIFSLDSIDPSHSVSVYNNSNQNNVASSSMEGQSFVVGGNPDLPIEVRPTTFEEKSFFNNAFSFNPVSVTSEGEDKNEGKKESGNKEQTADSKKQGTITGDVDDDSKVTGGNKDDGKTSADNKLPAINDDSRPIISDKGQNDGNKYDPIPDQPKVFNVYYAGDLNTSDSSAKKNFKGDFGFKVNLADGKYSDGFINGQVKGEGVFNALNGKGVLHSDGTFSASDYLVSGTGTYKDFNSAAMSGTITDKTTNMDWLIQGGGLQIGGTGRGSATDSIIYAPYNDKKASFAGSYVFASPVSSDAESGFGFDLMLVSGAISNAYLYYTDNLGAFKAENGYGKADARNKNYLGNFRINWSPKEVKGYGDKDFMDARSDLKLIGEITNKDSAVSITDGGAGGFVITGGTGNLVSSLPGITPEKTVMYSAFWKSGGFSDMDLADSENYYKFGFKINYLTGNISDVYAYGGQFHEAAVAGSGLYTNDSSPFFINGGKGKFEGDNLNLKFTSMQYGGNYDHQGFSLVGSLVDDKDFNGGLQYDGLGGLFYAYGLGNPTVFIKSSYYSGVPWEPLPFMIGYYEGSGSKMGNEFKTGFRANLVTGKISLAYLSIDNPFGKFRAGSGSGLIENDGEYSVEWASRNISFNDAFPGASKAKLEGEISSDYRSAEAEITLIDGSGSSIFDSDIRLNYGNTFSGARGYYSAAIGASSSSSSFAHNGGTLGISVDLTSGLVSDGGFNIVLPGAGSADKVVYGYSGSGTISGNILDVNWRTVIDENRSYSTYESAKLVGDITKASNNLTLTNRGGTVLLVSDSIGFSGPDYTTEKVGTVSGNITEGGRYQFSANLNSGTIRDATISVAGGSGSLTGSNGSGYISGGNFNIGNYSIGSTGGVLNGYNNVNMNGLNSGKDFTDIQWKATNGFGGVQNGTASNGALN